MLTRKQLDLFTFIHGRIRESGVAPSFDEMRDALDLKSKSGIHRLVHGLEERGYIRVMPNRARAIEVLREPAAAAADARPAPGTVVALRPSRQVSVPVMGRIAAGTPVAAIQNLSRTVDLPEDMVSGGEHYALEVRGDSMVDAGIHDGDLAVIRRQDSADTGDIVVALIDGEEATLKRLRRKGSSIALEAANPAYPTRILEAGRIRIQGRLVSLVRRY